MDADRHGLILRDDDETTAEGSQIAGEGERFGPEWGAGGNHMAAPATRPSAQAASTAPWRNDSPKVCDLAPQRGLANREPKTRTGHLNCKNSVELRGFEPLTPSMRTRSRLSLVMAHGS